MESDDELRALRAAADRRLDAQAGRAALLQTYYDGDEEIPAILDTAERKTFKALLREAGANWCELIVATTADRLHVEGFRFADDGSDEIWRLWQANSMDADSLLVHNDALTTGSGFVLVQDDDDNPTGVSITAESPQEATVLYEPGSRRRRAAGYKRFKDGNGDTTAVLITPDSIATWYGDSSAGPPDVEPNGAGFVGMIEIVPQPKTHGWPRSELDPALRIQDRINTTIFARVVATDYAAHRQVWATGVKLAREVIGQDASGEDVVRAIAPFNVGANRLLVNERAEGRFGAIPESNLGGYLAAVEQDVTHMAAITRTPPYYLLGALVNLSADAIRAAEAGLTAKVANRATFIGEGWEEVARSALRIVGHPAAADLSGEVIWQDFKTQSLGQLVDALTKLATLGVPREVLWELYGATPQQVGRWKELAAAEQAAAAANAATMLGAPEGAYAALLTAANGAAGGGAT